MGQTLALGILPLFEVLSKSIPPLTYLNIPVYDKPQAPPNRSSGSSRDCESAAMWLRTPLLESLDGNVEAIKRTVHAFAAKWLFAKNTGGRKCNLSAPVFNGLI